MVEKINVTELAEWLAEREFRDNYVYRDEYELLNATDDDEPYMIKGKFKLEAQEEIEEITKKYIAIISQFKAK